MCLVVELHRADTAMPFHILTAIPNRELLIIESRFGVIKDQIST